MLIVFGWIFFSLRLTLLSLCTVIRIDAGGQGALIAGGTVIIAVLAARDLVRASVARLIAARPPVDTPQTPSSQQAAVARLSKRPLKCASLGNPIVGRCIT
ncbi:MAG: hypothetical protein ACI9U2_004960, partial [Bradymonadia bacterium]